MTRLWIGLTLFVTALLIALVLPAWQVRAQKLEFHSQNQSPQNHFLAAGQPSRVEVDLARRIESWQGTRTCASGNRARLALKPVFAHWLGLQMMAHPGKTLALWGYHSGDIWAEDRIADGKPRCSAGFRKLIAYAEFR